MADILVIVYQGGGAPLRLANLWYYNKYPEDTSAPTPNELGSTFVLKNTYKAYGSYSRPVGLYWHARDDQAPDPSALGDFFTLKNQYRPYQPFVRPASLYHNPPQDVTPSTPNAEGSSYVARSPYAYWKPYSKPYSLYHHSRDDQAADPSEPGRDFTLRNIYSPYKAYRTPAGFYGFYRDDSVPPPPPGSSRADGVFIIPDQSQTGPLRLATLWYYNNTTQDISAPDPGEAGRDFVLRNTYRPSTFTRPVSIYWSNRDDQAPAGPEGGRDFVLRNQYKSGKYQYNYQLNWFGRDDQAPSPFEVGRDFVLRNVYKPSQFYARTLSILNYGNESGLAPAPEGGRDQVVRNPYSPTVLTVALYLSAGDGQADDPLEVGRDFTLNKGKYQPGTFKRFSFNQGGIDGGITTPVEFGRDFTLSNIYKSVKYKQPLTINYRDDQAPDAFEPGRDFVLRNAYNPGKYRYNYQLNWFQRDDSLVGPQESGRDFVLRSVYRPATFMRVTGLYWTQREGSAPSPGEAGRDFTLRNIYKSSFRYSKPIGLYASWDWATTVPVPPVPPVPPTPGPEAKETPHGGQFLSIKTIGRDKYHIVGQQTIANRPDATGYNGLYWAEDIRRLSYDSGVWNDIAGSDTTFIVGTSGSGTTADPFTGWDTNTVWQSYHRYVFGPYVYAYSVNPAWQNLLGVSLIGSGESVTVLKFTGTGTALTFSNATYLNSPGWTVQDMLVVGNALTVDGISIVNMHRSTFSRIRYINCTGKAFRITGPVLCDFYRLIASSVYGDQTTKPTNGFWLESSGGVQTVNDNTFVQCLAEGVSGAGVVLNGAAINDFINGTSENNLRGYEIQNATCYSNNFIGCDGENNSSTEDWLLSASYGNTIQSCQSTGKIRLAVNSFSNTITGGYHDTIQVDAGALQNTISSLSIDVSGTGSLIDNGTNTTIFSVRDQFFGFMLPNQIIQAGADLTFVNGSNGDFALTGSLAAGEQYRILGPSAAFSLSGLNPIPGLGMSRSITLLNTTAQTFTIKYDDAVGSPTASHRFYCPGGADFVVGAVLKSVTVRYIPGYSRWVVTASS